jgi:nucleoside-diphosphate-sugar epimerase
MATSPPEPRVLVTGAYGCIGAWVVRELVEREIPVVTFDLGGDDYRLGLTMSREDASRVPRVQGDITDLAHFERALDEHDERARGGQEALGAHGATRVRIVDRRVRRDGRGSPLA